MTHEIEHLGVVALTETSQPQHHGDQPMNIAVPKTSHLASVRCADSALPILIASGPALLHIRAGSAITVDGQDRSFPEDAPVLLGPLIPGEDYGVKLDADGKPVASLLGPENPLDAGWIAGFHFAPGGNATARQGGDSIPAINPRSIWDLGFRPTCPDPRGMARVDRADGSQVWIDIYLLGTDHARNGTSRCGAKIADGKSLDRLNHADAIQILSGHGKRLPTYDEFCAAAFGVTERSSADRHPKTTGLDDARTSQAGVMQATGNLWQWGTDGDPDDPRPSVFGGSWFVGAFAGSRFADLDCWPEFSDVFIGARGASDHLTPA